MNTVIQIFAKAPEPGQVKTRLSPALTLEQAAVLYRRLVIHTLETALAADLGSVELWCTPSTDKPFFQSCAEKFGITLHRQQGDDLGAKISHALDASLQHGRRTILIGSDCPAITADYLRSAASALMEHDFVFGPADDGGYVLVGAARRNLDCFSGIAWSTAQVMAQTRQRLQAIKASWYELPSLWDVDTPDNLAKLAQLPEFYDIRTA